MANQITNGTPAVRGRPFVKGNGGRRHGSKNKNSVILEALSDSEKEQLVRKGIELAKAGDVSMLKFFLSRILPRERVVIIDLPKMESVDDAVEALGAITSAVCEGKITAGEAAHLAALVNSYARAIDIADLVKRMEALEARVIGSA
jgi:hypothetical protein